MIETDISKVYELIERMRLEVKQDSAAQAATINQNMGRLEKKFDDLEAGRLTRVETKFAELEARLEVSNTKVYFIMAAIGIFISTAATIVINLVTKR